VPLRLEFRQSPTDFFEIHAIRSFVGPRIFRKLDLAVGHDNSDDLSQVSNAIVVGGLSDVERLVEYPLRGRFERSNERAGDILNVHDRAPWGAIRLQMN